MHIPHWPAPFNTYVYMCYWPAPLNTYICATDLLYSTYVCICATDLYSTHTSVFLTCSIQHTHTQTHTHTHAYEPLTSIQHIHLCYWPAPFTHYTPAPLTCVTFTFGTGNGSVHKSIAFFKFFLKLQPLFLYGVQVVLQFWWYPLVDAQEFLNSNSTIVPPGGWTRGFKIKFYNSTPWWMDRSF